MRDPEPCSAFRHRGGEAFLLRSPRLTIQERPFVGKTSIRGRDGDATFVSRFRAIFGVEPPPPGAAVETAPAIVLPVGRTEWLVVERHPASAASSGTVGSVRDRLSAAGLIAVDVGSATTILRLSGTGLHSTMRKLAGLPMDRMPAGGVARTWVGKFAVIVHILAPDRADLLIARSFARSLLEQIQDAEQRS